MDSVRTPKQRALVELGQTLRDRDFDFTAVTPSTYHIVQSRPQSSAITLRDIFGWNRSFCKDSVPYEILTLMRKSRIVKEGDDGLRSAVRFSTLGKQIYVHSAFPTNERRSVFFGPDTYRFCALIQREGIQGLRGRLRRIADIGCGSGAAGLWLAALLAEGVEEVVLADVNPVALFFAQVNVDLNKSGACETRVVKSDLLRHLDGKFSIILCNPPFLIDPDKRLYRHGGELGIALALRVLEEAPRRLTRGGKLIVYTGTPIIDGQDTFFLKATQILNKYGYPFRYEEIDPDIFSEELTQPAYCNVERIAAVSLCVTV